MRSVSSWGRLSADPHELVSLDDPRRVPELVTRHKPGIAYGLGRSYGDICLNPGGVLWTTSHLDHMTGFDAEAGVLTCEAGVSLRDIQRLMAPRGWMLAVTPGTQFVTVGGAIANDVHGKNHHVHGTFAEHVRRIRLQRTDGTQIDCGPTENRQWFAATVGGMGLTGLIVHAELQLKRVPGPWLETEAIAYTGLDEFFALSTASEPEWENVVSWIDCSAGADVRGVLLRGRPTTVESVVERRRLRARVGIDPPVSLINHLTLKAFNAVYYHTHRRRRGRSVVHYEPFFYPLDNVHEWNRIYGPRGFYQYQSVLPPQAALEGTHAMLRAIAESGQGSFLAVLKTFGDREPVGMMSFPRAGVTLALDFPNAGERTGRLFERLDGIVRDAGGCIYPAKDARMPRNLFEAGFPRLSEFLEYRDPGTSSALSRRLIGS